MRIGFSLSITQPRGVVRGGGSAPSISIASGGGYAGSVYASNMAGQWYADGVAIAGAMGATFTMAVQYEGTEIYQIVEQAPVISIASGSGYAGSLYRSNASGQWYADGSAIPGATGSSWTMTVQYEGAEIYQDGVVEMKSNVIKMWVPGAIAPSTHLSRRREETVTVSGGAVVSWANLGASGGAVAQDTASMQPLDNVAQINGQPTIRFSRGDGLNCGLTFPYALTAGAKTVVLIGKPTGETIANRTILGGGTSVASNNSFLPLAQSGSTNGEYVRNLSGLEWRANGAAKAIATRGEAYTALLNSGETAVHDIYTSAQAAYTDSALLGYGATGAFCLGFDVAEFIIVDRALTDDERASLSAYANAVYGVAA